MTCTTSSKRYSYQADTVLGSQCELALLGFPQSFKLGGISLTQKRDLIGESMALPALMTCLFPIVVHTPWPAVDGPVFVRDVPDAMSQ